jgi:hypothetical protein
MSRKKCEGIKGAKLVVRVPMWSVCQRADASFP